MSFFRRLISNHQEDSSAVESDESQSLFDPVLGERKCVSGKKSLYITRAKLLFYNDKVIIWELNRPLDLEHMNKIRASFDSEYKESGDITVYGSIGLFKHEECYKIFDGQHRLEALRNFLNDHSTFNPELTLEVYETNDPIALFTNLNHVKIQEQKHKPSAKKEQLSKALQDKYGDLIKNTNRTTRPRIILKAIIDTINTSNLVDEPVDKIMTELEGYNTELSELSIDRLFGKEYEKNPKLCHKIYDEAAKLKFYLGVRPLKQGKLDWSILF